MIIFKISGFFKVVVLKKKKKRKKKTINVYLGYGNSKNALRFSISFLV